MGKETKAFFIYQYKLARQTIKARKSKTYVGARVGVAKSFVEMTNKKNVKISMIRVQIGRIS